MYAARWEKLVSERNSIDVVSGAILVESQVANSQWA